MADQGPQPSGSVRPDEDRTATPEVLPGRWIAAGALLCAVATLLFYVGSLLGGTKPSPVPTPAADAATARVPEAPTAAPVTDADEPDRLPPSPPVRLEVPALDIDTRLGRVGRTPEGNIGAPDDADTAAWYEKSVSPGELGTTVVVGHVDSTAGPAVFYRLATLEPGAEVRITRADGQVVVFAVDAIRAYPKDEFPARDVLKPRGRPELRLITCGGRFDRRSGYTENVIVFAHMVGKASPIR